MLYVKIMSGEDMPDTFQHKNYTIVPVANNEVMQFVENPLYMPPCEDTPTTCKYQLLVHSPEGGNEIHDLSGNAYVMNESGKTIATHACD